MCVSYLVAIEADDEHADHAEYEWRLYIESISRMIESLEAVSLTAVRPYDAFRENPRPSTTVGKKLLTAAEV